MFGLPFIAFVLDWLFAALVFITLLIVATHVLNGGIMFQPPRPKVRPATKAHVAVLLAVLAVVKAADYWVTRYELTTESRGLRAGRVLGGERPAAGADAADAHRPAHRRAVPVDAADELVAAAADRVGAVGRDRAVGGDHLPGGRPVARRQPQPARKEAPYIDRNVDATRHALGIDNVARKEVSFADITPNGARPTTSHRCRTFGC